MTRKFLRVNGIDVRSRESRVRQAVASARLEGHELSPQVLELFQRYANHEVTYEEVVALADSGAHDDVPDNHGPRLG